MNLDQMYPSKWLKASDLQGQTVPVTISRVLVEDVGDDAGKPVLYFHGKDKGLVLNKTNAMSIGVVHGQETDNWVGKTIELFPTVVMFQGQNVPAIRVRPVAAAYVEAYGAPERPVAPLHQGPGDKAAAKAVEAPLQPTPVPNIGGHDLDDEIKF